MNTGKNTTSAKARGKGMASASLREGFTTGSAATAGRFAGRVTDLHLFHTDGRELCTL
ncbi:MAG: hypothetical protein LBV65_00565 [Desulfovibrio sp.]|nr:hypothetical protein [Desulfovibrio sp.]